MCSNYKYETASYTFECIQQFKGGNALFHNLDTSTKLGGAPYKIMYLATYQFRKHGVLNQFKVAYWSGGTRLFAEPKFEKTLLELVKRGNVQLNFNVKLTTIDGEKKAATFVGLGAIIKMR